MSGVRRSLLNSNSVKELPNYLCFTALEDGTFTYSIPSSMSTNDISYVKYSLDGYQWITLDNIDNENVSITTPNIKSGDKIYWKGVGKRLAKSSSVYSNFSSTCKFDVSGNIASLLYEDTFETFYSAPRYEYMFGYVFKSSLVVHAGKLILPVTKVYYSYYLYQGLFMNCTELIECAPIIFANVLNCWKETYKGCTKLENPPIFPSNLAWTANAVFYEMFSGCTNLKIAPDLPYKSLTSQCYAAMFKNCTSLIVPPSLPATTVVNQCYIAMFDGCTSLVDAPELNAIDAPTTGGSMYKEMFRNTKINYLKCLMIPSTDLKRWMTNVPNVSTSIFVKHIDATWITTGDDGVPTNWTVIYYDPAVDKYYTDQTRATECDDHGNPI